MSFKNDIDKLFAEMLKAAQSGNWEHRRSLLWGNAEPIRNYLYSFAIEGSDSSFIKEYVNDALARFFLTLDLVGNTTKGRVLEIGGNPYLFSVLLKRLYEFDATTTNFFSLSVYDKKVEHGQQRVISNDFGEEYTFDYQTLNVELSEYPYEEGSFDIVFFCEVLEHVVVDPLAIFEKLRRIIAPGGRLILTTPNALRLINFAHMIAGKNFFDRYHSQNGIYGRHNREFSLTEVTSLLENNGFAIEVAKTADRYNYDELSMFVDSYDKSEKLPWTGSELRDLLRKIGANEEDRGDNIYVVARRAE